MEQLSLKNKWDIDAKTILYDGFSEKGIENATVKKLKEPKSEKGTIQNINNK